MNISRQARTIYESAFRSLYGGEQKPRTVYDQNGDVKLTLESAGSYFETLAQQTGVTKLHVVQQLQTFLRDVDSSPIPDDKKMALADELYAFVVKHFGDEQVPNPEGSKAKGDWDTLDFPNALDPAFRGDTDKAQDAVMKATSYLSGKYPQSQTTLKKSPELDKADYDPETDLQLISENWLTNMFHKPESHVFFNEPTVHFIGHIQGKPFKAMKEGQLFKHLTSQHKMEPLHAQQTIERFKAGITNGHGTIKPEHLLSNALQHANFAKLHHDAGNLAAKEHHLKKSMSLLDRATELASTEQKKNSKAFAGITADHPMMKTFTELERAAKTIPE